MRIFVLCLLAAACAPTVARVDPIADDSDTEQDVDVPEWTWTARWMPMALDRLFIQGQRTASDTCVELVLVSPGYDATTYPVEVTSPWSLERAAVLAVPCDEDPFGGGDPPDVLTGRITVNTDWPPAEVGLDLTITSDRQRWSVDDTVQVGP